MSASTTGPGPDRQEACGHDLLTTLVVGFPGQDVSRDLLLNKAVVGLVGIERIDDVVAISPGLPCRNAATLAQTVGIARQIEPVPSPALAESWRSQNPLNDLLEGEFGIVSDKRLDVFGLRGKTGEIEVNPSQQRVTVSLGGRVQTLGLQPRQNEVVYGMGGPGIVPDRRRGALFHRLPGPVARTALYPHIAQGTLAWVRFHSCFFS